MSELRRRAAVLAAGLAIVSLVPSSALAQARPAQMSPVRIQVVASGLEGPPSSAQWVGIRFVVEPGWHIYWRNPGDSGGPPEVQWRLPGGLTTGALQWPVPERIADGTMVNYGYHRDVVLPARLRATAGLPPKPFAITAQVKWLVCRNICIPGKGEASLEVPAQGKLPSADAEAIRKALSAVPQPAPKKWRLGGQAEGDTFVLSIETGRRETLEQFFPLVAGEVDPAAPVQASPTASGLRIVLRKSEYLASPPARLKGVIVLSGGPAYEVAVPLNDAAPLTVNPSTVNLLTTQNR